MAKPLMFIEYMAESEGFEPSRRFHAYTISSRAPSAARTTLRVDDGELISAIRLIIKWRRGWDSNPRYLAVHLISSQAPSTSRTPLRNTLLSLCGRPRISSFAKKSLHCCSALFLAYPCGNFQTMIQGRMLNNVKYRFNCASLIIRTAINQTVHPAHHQGACTHWTRFYRYI